MTGRDLIVRAGHAGARNKRGYAAVKTVKARVAIVIVSIAIYFSQVPMVLAQSSLDFPIPNGHFYTQANGRGGAGGTGYAIVDAVQSFPTFGRVSVPFDTAFRQYGGVPILGFPASRVTVFPDFPIQVNQKLVLQLQPGRGIFFLNTFDILHERGFDAFLDAARDIPPPFDTSPDGRLPSFAAVTARHQAFLNQDPAIRTVYFSARDPLRQFGLPMSFKDYGNVFVIRAQRAAFQHWRVDVGPNKAGSVTIVNGGDIGKEVGLFPAPAVVPEGPPNFNANLIVLQPGTNQTVRSPMAVGGYARLFEAAGNFELRNAAGQIFASGPFLAAIGTSPDFGRFDFTVTFSVPTHQVGTLTLFSQSPATGARINVVNVPISLSP